MGNQTDLIVNHIVKSIEDGRLNPGDVIEEKALVSEFGVSRTPVREALLQLDAVGILKRKPRGGAEVFRPTLEEFLAILEVHGKLEGHAAALAARRLSPADAMALDMACSACDGHAMIYGDDKPDLYYQHNLEFHRTIAIASHNDVLLDLIRTNGRKLLAYYRARYRYKGSIGKSATEHRQIAQLILDRDSAAAEALMVSHVTFDSVTAMDLLAVLFKP
ncbi:GntR family transcriptional regulator [Gellertiella hungarica]|uniref:DNA-binding GntR family transcriptional regulator n=1 Tax=Gellertiella hungarica TaxID=1572859 RepID=A0A7W6J1C3_9HYPH|nr:GntR family transcriptional regulator [Gellertiella hungarica]MBB4062959.1 DNA-binding GntR family transcriptional regulator [Gellertiella hungarica]